MNNEKFTIRAYGKSELAMLYRNDLCKKSALKSLKTWLEANPRLAYLSKTKAHSFTPKQVKMIVEEVGEPFDIV